MLPAFSFCPRQCRTTYDYSGNTETYTIYDLSSNELIDSFSVTYPMQTASADGTSTSFFTHDQRIGAAVSLRFTACVDNYSQGSFRCFNALRYTNPGINRCVTSCSLENTDKSAWSSSGKWPTTRLDYAYTTNIVTNGSVSASAGEILANAGFPHNIHYYRHVSNAGSFNLYNG